MKLRLFIIPGILAAVLLGQGFGRRGVNSTPNQPASQLTPAQLATREIQSVVTVLKLDSTQSSALAGDSGLVTALTTNLMTLQSNEEMIKTDYAALSTELIGSPAAQPAEFAEIQPLLTSSFQLRVANAGAIVSALQSLSAPLSAEQTANLPKMIEMLIR